LPYTLEIYISKSTAKNSPDPTGNMFFWKKIIKKAHMRACVPFVLSYQAAIPIRLESHPKQLELVGDTNLYTGDAVTVISTVEFTQLLVIIVGVSNINRK